MLEKLVGGVKKVGLMQTEVLHQALHGCSVTFEPAVAVGGGVESGSAKNAMATAMSSSRNLDAKRRFSQSAQLRANLPLLAE